MQNTNSTAFVCALCENTISRKLPFHYNFRGRQLDGVRCTTCGLVAIHPQPEKAEIAAMYEEEYFTSNTLELGAHGKVDYFTQKAGKEKTMDQFLERIETKIPTIRTFLEIGCGPGFLLKRAAMRGWQVTGLEISAYACDYAKNQFGLDVHQGDIETHPFTGKSYDCIFLGDVLEHLPTPRHSLIRVKDLLAPNGLLVVAVPSTLNLFSARIGFWLYGLLRKDKTLRIPPYHLFEYEPSTLQKMLAAVGFQRIRIVQSALHPQDMALRGNTIENIGKVALQIPTYFLSRLFNFGGDRLTVFAKLQ